MEGNSGQVEKGRKFQNEMSYKVKPQPQVSDT